MVLEKNLVSPLPLEAVSQRNRVIASDPAMAGERGNLIDFTFYCRH
jgi:hypothetical protein